MLEIIAGPCSITFDNVKEIIHEIADVKTPDGKRAVYGTRVVGLKSRTVLDPTGEGMGIDCSGVQACLRAPLDKRGQIVLPSVLLASEIVKETGMLVAAEIMLPDIQLPFYAEQPLLDGKLLIWNPSVNQLGWHITQMAEFAKKHHWQLGIKNGKFLGDVHLAQADHPDYAKETSLEKTWLGLTAYAQPLYIPPILIHRGVDVADKGEYRNAPVHEIVKRIKRNNPSAKIYFDPSHSFGPKLRNHIVQGTIDAMKLMVNNAYVYDGILIETGTSPSDTAQHISTKELSQMVNELCVFRELKGPGQTQNNSLDQEYKRIYES